MFHSLLRPPPDPFPARKSPAPPHENMAHYHGSFDRAVRRTQLHLTAPHLQRLVEVARIIDQRPGFALCMERGSASQTFSFEAHAVQAEQEHEHT